MFESYHPQNTIDNNGFPDSHEKKAKNLNKSERFRRTRAYYLLDDIESSGKNGIINKNTRQ